MMPREGLTMSNLFTRLVTLQDPRLDNYLLCMCNQDILVHSDNYLAALSPTEQIECLRALLKCHLMRDKLIRVHIPLDKLSAEGF